MHHEQLDCSGQSYKKDDMLVYKQAFEKLEEIGAQIQASSSQEERNVLFEQLRRNAIFIFLKLSPGRITSKSEREVG